MQEALGRIYHTQNEPATRETPALTIAQMRTMALDARWWSGS
ncbi:hypothetical protein ACFW93_17640 [Streptomyces canus]